MKRSNQIAADLTLATIGALGAAAILGWEHDEGLLEIASRSAVLVTAMFLVVFVKYRGWWPSSKWLEIPSIMGWSLVMIFLVYGLVACSQGIIAGP